MLNDIGLIDTGVEGDSTAKMFLICLISLRNRFINRGGPYNFGSTSQAVQSPMELLQQDYPQNPFRVAHLLYPVPPGYQVFHLYECIECVLEGDTEGTHGDHSISSGRPMWSGIRPLMSLETWVVSTF